MNKKEENISKHLSFLLRHDKETVSPEKSVEGWVEVSEILNKLKITPILLDKIVAEDKKQRYSYSSDKKFIRANQGHSIEGINPGLTEKDPPEYLWHGTSLRNWTEHICSEGLKPMSRLMVHLSLDESTALTVGARHGRPIALKVHSGEMFKEGYKFFISENNVWLTNKVPVEYLEMTSGTIGLEDTKHD